MPRPPSKKSLAISELDAATHAVQKAIRLLGGRLTARSAKSDPRKFIARQFLESIDKRLLVTKDLLGVGPTHPITVTLIDNFERTYDTERRPEC
jgi:hypothetical protein